MLLLRNLVAPGEVDAELEAEVRDEAGQFGTIQQVVIHETKTNVLIFVLFAQSADCAKARASLDKRIFAGKLIRAIAYPKSKVSSISQRRDNERARWIGQRDEQQEETTHSTAHVYFLLRAFLCCLAMFGSSAAVSLLLPSPSSAPPLQFDASIYVPEP